MTKEENMQNYFIQQEKEIKNNVERLDKEIEIIDKSEYITKKLTIIYKGEKYFVELYYEDTKFVDMSLSNEYENITTNDTDDLYDDIHDWITFSNLIN